MDTHFLCSTHFKVFGRITQWICTDKFTLFFCLLVWINHIHPGWIIKVGVYLQTWGMEEVIQSQGYRLGIIEKMFFLIHGVNHLNKGKRGTKIMWVGQHKIFIRTVISQPFKLILPWKTVFKSMMQVSLNCTNEKRKVLKCKFTCHLLKVIHY